MKRAPAVFWAGRDQRPTTYITPTTSNITTRSLQLTVHHSLTPRCGVVDSFLVIQVTQPNADTDIPLSIENFQNLDLFNRDFIDQERGSGQKGLDGTNNGKSSDNKQRNVKSDGMRCRK
jgi:hypothetical protein